ncbi:hypothetical protein L7F22_056893 [Adiantum nelumboides]|nr:hypothetical protein [Adiantum nelumboides]
MTMGEETVAQGREMAVEFSDYKMHLPECWSKIFRWLLAHSDLEDREVDQGNEVEPLRDEPIDVELFQTNVVEELDPEWMEAQEFLQTGKIPEDWPQSRNKALIIKSLKFSIIRSFLYRLGIDGVLKRCVPLSARMQIIIEAHTNSSGKHFSTDITHNKILKAGLWWQSMMVDVKSFCKTCDICQRMGRPTTADMTPLITTIQPLEVFKKWGLDFMGPFKTLTPRKSKYIVMATCYVSKWVKAKASPNNATKSTAWFLHEHVICRNGCPIEIVFDQGTHFIYEYLDQGTHFINETIEILTKLFSIKHKNSRPYYSRCNDQAESSNKTIKAIPTNIVQKEPHNWDEQLQTTLWAYRIAYKVTTGITPFGMVYGTDTVVPLEFVVSTLRMEKQNDMDFNKVLKARLEELQKLDEIKQRALLEKQGTMEEEEADHDDEKPTEGTLGQDLVFDDNDDQDDPPSGLGPSSGGLPQNQQTLLIPSQSHLYQDQKEDHKGIKLLMVEKAKKN